MELSEAVKAALRMLGLLECCRLVHMEASVFVDTDAVRSAVGRGASTKLGHVREHAEVNLDFLRQCKIPLKRVDTTDMPADVFTNIVSVQRLEWHMTHFVGKDHV